MVEYIERKQAIVDACNSLEQYPSEYARLEDALNKIPAVDAVPVVRCKDCIRRYDTDECPMCHVSGGQYYEYTSDNGYCDKGERKEDD